MKTIYFISNNLLSKSNIIYDKDVAFDYVRENKPLSIKGEEEALKISNLDIFKDTEVIYSSSEESAINTSKYISEKNDLDIILDKDLGERKIGELCSNEYRYLKGMQEHDFTYKLEKGESIEIVKKRITRSIKDILKTDYENIVVISHNIALLSLFLNWCHASFNLNDELILEYKDKAIFDGITKDIDLIKVNFDDMKIIDIERIK